MHAVSQLLSFVPNVSDFTIFLSQKSNLFACACILTISLFNFSRIGGTVFQEILINVELLIHMSRPFVYMLKSR
jgi:hypothetical protein